ncbi:LCP family protein [Spirulina sp. CS-785/01]|uniref:LCP family protein n=1 Tax=Spirulina sp. CS-785/01 TaxID=3021716 RepID=UPI00232FE616|nr:LCP family protein [Spirulina sp. CS-785/01]MDB9315573.1 LCP family protein [Spirulina sp. CS-785/01]
MKQSIDVHANKNRGRRPKAQDSTPSSSLNQKSPVTKKQSSPPSSTAKAKPSLSWGRRMVWSSTFVVAATLSATVGATVALVSPLPSIPGFLVTENEVATATESKGSTTSDAQPLNENTEIPSLLEYQIERPVNILVMGIDQVPETEPGTEEAFNGNTDTIILLRFDPNDQSLRMLSIPRDTQVMIPGVGMAKINSANWRGGAETAVNVVSNTLNDVPIDRYVRVTNNAFRELVDLLGGIEVFVPQDMAYEDKTQGLKIDLEKGLQTLNGDEAEQFTRFRMDEYGDIGRVQRQQILLKALREKVSRPSVLPRVPKAVQMMLQYVDTNLSLEEMLALVNFGMNLERDDIQMVLLPGHFSDPEQFEGKSYWLMSRRGRDRVVSELFEHEGHYVPVDNRSLNRVRIALQNATPEEDFLKTVSQDLREKEFRNLYVSQSEAPRVLQTTEIIVQQGDMDAAEAIREALGFGKIVADSTGDLGSEITIRVGKDWLSRQPQEQQSEEKAE